MGMCSITRLVWTMAHKVGGFIHRLPTCGYSQVSIYQLPVHSSRFVCGWVVVSVFSANNQILPSLFFTYLFSKLTMISCVSPVHAKVRKVLRHSLEVKQQGYRVWAQSNINKLTSLFQQTRSSCVRVPTITDSGQTVGTSNIMIVITLFENSHMLLHVSDKNAHSMCVRPSYSVVVDRRFHLPVANRGLDARIEKVHGKAPVLQDSHLHVTMN